MYKIKLPRLFMRRYLVSLVLWAILLVFSGGVYASPVFVVQPKGKLWLTGNSTMHEYESIATRLEASLTLAQELKYDTVTQDLILKIIQKKQWKSFELKVPVKEMKSSKKGLDEKLYASMKEKEFPNILFRLLSIDLVSASPIKVKATGVLSVAGKEKNVQVDATIKPEANGFWIEGQRPLLMTDFGIKPPHALLGAVRAEDAIVIHYKLFAGTI
jgi:hypothetical protein